MPMYVIDTGSKFDRPIEKGQWAVSDIPGQGKEIIESWIKERIDCLMAELRYAQLDEKSGPHKIDNIRTLAEDFNVQVDVEVTITKKRKKRNAVTRKAKR